MGSSFSINGYLTNIGVACLTYSTPPTQNFWWPSFTTDNSKCGNFTLLNSQVFATSNSGWYLCNYYGSLLLTSNPGYCPNGKFDSWNGSPNSNLYLSGSSSYLELLDNYSGSCGQKQCPGVGTNGYPLTIYCVAGHGDNTNGNLCSVCPTLGYYSKVGDTKCSLCPTGTYATSTGVGSCKTCPTGFSSLLGSTSCYTGGDRDSEFNLCLYPLSLGCISYPNTGSPYSFATPGYPNLYSRYLFNFSSDTGFTYLSQTNPIPGVSHCASIPPTEYTTGATSLCTVQTTIDIYKSYYYPRVSIAGNSVGNLGVNYMGRSLYMSAYAPGDDPVTAYNNNFPMIYVQCGPGYGMNPSSPNCMPCFHGSYSPVNSGMSTCSPCPAGTYSNKVGAISCTACSSGTYSIPGSISCFPICPYGYRPSANGVCAPISGVAPTTASPSFNQCTPGTYSSNGYAPCQPCSTGTTSIINGATSCINCPYGTMSYGGSFCTYCPAGTIATNGNGCVLTPSNTYTQGVPQMMLLASSPTPPLSSGSLNSCPSGTYSTPGSAICSSCPVATYYPNPDAPNICHDCIGGSYNPVPGSPYCLPCPSGTFSGNRSSSCSNSCYSPSANSYTCGFTYSGLAFWCNTQGWCNYPNGPGLDMFSKASGYTTNQLIEIIVPTVTLGPFVFSSIVISQFIYAAATTSSQLNQAFFPTLVDVINAAYNGPIAIGGAVGGQSGAGAMPAGYAEMVAAQSARVAAQQAATVEAEVVTSVAEAAIEAATEAAAANVGAAVGVSLGEVIGEAAIDVAIDLIIL
jgi:hypothetical protein